MIAVFLIILLLLILLFAIIDLLFGDSLSFPGKKLYFAITVTSLVFSFVLAERGVWGAGPYNVVIDLVFTYILVIVVLLLVRMFFFIELSVSTIIVAMTLLALPLVVRVVSKNIYS